MTISIRRFNDGERLGLRIACSATVLDCFLSLEWSKSHIHQVQLGICQQEFGFVLRRFFVAGVCRAKACAYHNKYSRHKKIWKIVCQNLANTNAKDCNNRKSQILQSRTAHR